MTNPLNYRGGRQFPQSILDDIDARLNALESKSAQSGEQCEHCKVNRPYHDLGCPVAVERLAAKSAQSGEQDERADFKNFHRLLCDRFGYAHDERDWQRDQLSLIEWIATATQPVQTERALTERLIAAIEGECDGLAITGEQASSILAYLQYGAPMDDVRRDAERYRKLRSADINAIHKGGVFAGLTPDNVVINGEDLDIAVDLLIDDAAQPASSLAEGDKQ